MNQRFHTDRLAHSPHSAQIQKRRHRKGEIMCSKLLISLSRMRHAISMHIKFYQRQHCFTPMNENGNRRRVRFLSISYSRTHTRRSRLGACVCISWKTFLNFTCTISMTQAEYLHSFECVCVCVGVCVARWWMWHFIRELHARSSWSVYICVYILDSIDPQRNRHWQRHGCRVNVVCRMHNDGSAMPCRTPHSYRNWIFSHIRWYELEYPQ